MRGVISLKSFAMIAKLAAQRLRTLFLKELCLQLKRSIYTVTKFLIYLCYFKFLPPTHLLFDNLPSLR